MVSGLDIYSPALAFIISLSVGEILQSCSNILEKFGIDDAVGVGTINGTIGLYGVVILGVFTSDFQVALDANGNMVTDFSGWSNSWRDCTARIASGLYLGSCGYGKYP